MEHQSNQLATNSFHSAYQGATNQQGSGFMPSTSSPSFCTMGHQGSGPSAPLIVCSSSARGLIRQQNSGLIPHSNTSSYSEQGDAARQGSTGLMHPSPSISSNRDVFDGQDMEAPGRITAFLEVSD